MPMENARLLIEVQAGVVPGKPLEEHTRRWAITTSDWERMHRTDEDVRRSALDHWDSVHGHAREYAARLQDPGRLNWVRLDWVWL